MSDVKCISCKNKLKHYEIDLCSDCDTAENDINPKCSLCGIENVEVDEDFREWGCCAEAVRTGLKEFTDTLKHGIGYGQKTKV